MNDTVCLICGSTSHTSSSCQSEAAKALRQPRHASRAQAHLQPAWPFGEGYVSQLTHLYGKRDMRGQHNVGAPKAAALGITQNGKSAHEHRARDTSKFATKNPKAGKPLPGNRAPKGSK